MPPVAPSRGRAYSSGTSFAPRCRASSPWRNSAYFRPVPVLKMTTSSESVIQPIPQIAISNTLRAAVVGWAKTLAGEVAKEMGMTPGAIYVAKSRVLRRLREEAAGFSGGGAGHARALHERHRDAAARKKVGDGRADDPGADGSGRGLLTYSSENTMKMINTLMASAAIVTSSHAAAATPLAQLALGVDAPLCARGLRMQLARFGNEFAGAVAIDAAGAYIDQMLW